MRLALRLIAPLALCATPGIAQTPDAGAEQICILIGRVWAGDGADVRAIESVPVPDSYRRQFESPCGRDEAGLIDWHLRFGSARSIVPALAYLERDYLREVPTPDRYQAALESAWHAAQADLRRARNIRQPEGLNYSVPHRFIDSSRPIRRLRSLVQARVNFMLLARQYLRAAEEFASLPLLETAERHIRVAVTAGAFLAPLEREPPVASLLHFNLDTWITDDLDMWAAVLRARLTRAPEAIARAEAVVASKARPHYARLAELAFSGGEDFCDISDDTGERETIEAACAEDEDALHERVVGHLLARAMLDLVVEREAIGNWNASPGLALRLLNMERLPDRGRCCRFSTTEDLLRLHLAMAEFWSRQATSATARPSGSGAIQAWSDALGHLREAERLAPPFEMPARFRRIAEAWLDLWTQGPTLFPGDPGNPRSPTASPDSRRYASYLRAQLAALDEIATAGNTDLPASPN